MFVGEGPAISLVAADRAAVPEPPPLLAVSWTLIVCPTSASTSTYDCVTAPEIAEQLAPAESQRSQR